MKSSTLKRKTKVNQICIAKGKTVVKTQLPPDSCHED